MTETGLIIAEVVFLVLLYAFVWAVVRSASRQLSGSPRPPPPAPPAARRRAARSASRPWPPPRPPRPSRPPAAPPPLPPPVEIPEAPPLPAAVDRSLRGPHRVGRGGQRAARPVGQPRPAAGRRVLALPDGGPGDPAGRRHHDRALRGRRHLDLRPVRLPHARARHSPRGVPLRRGPRVDQRHLPERPPHRAATRSSRCTTPCGSARASSATRSRGPRWTPRAPRAASWPWWSWPTCPTRAACAGTTRTARSGGPPVIAVADGMGGAKAGEVAAQLAVEEVAAPRGARRRSGDVRAAVGRANAAIRRMASEDPDKSGHGHHLHGRDARGRAPRRRARGRLARLPLARRQAAPAHRGPLGGGRAGAPRQHQPGGRRAPPAPQRDHPGARRRAGGDRSTPSRSTCATATSCCCAATACRRTCPRRTSPRALADAVTLADAAKALVERANGAGGTDNVTVVLARVGVGGRRPERLDRRGAGRRRPGARRPSPPRRPR